MKKLSTEERMVLEMGSVFHRMTIQLCNDLVDSGLSPYKIEKIFINLDKSVDEIYPLLQNPIAKKCWERIQEEINRVHSSSWIEDTISDRRV